MMNTLIELPSGKIFNLSRFIALLPNEKTDGGYNLVLEGYSTPIVLEKEDVEILKIQLQSDTQNLGKTENKDLPISYDKSGWYREEQLQKNQPALALLEKRRQRHQNMDEDESKRREEFFADFKKMVDSERLTGQKLYSQT